MQINLLPVDENLMLKSKPYGALVYVYSHLMRKIRYDKWAEYLYKLVKNQIPKYADVLELAAGDCKFYEYFSIYYDNIILSDLSFEMLKSSINSAPKVCFSMTGIPLKKKFDLVYANFDSINYLLTIDELKKLFRETALILKPDGIFTFDISLEKNSFRHEKEIKNRQRNHGVIYEHHSTYNPRTRIHTNKFIINIVNGKSYIETHKQKIHPFEKYFEVITGTGLYVSECYQTFSFEEATAESERVQFLLKKDIHASV